MSDRNQSPAREDQRLTGNLINAAMGYLNNASPDESFARVVLDGCTSAKSAEYPPAGHNYPRQES